MLVYINYIRSASELEVAYPKHIFRVTELLDSDGTKPGGIFWKRGDLGKF